MTANAPIELRLLGRFSVRRAGQTSDIAIGSKKARVLLAYLAMQETMRASRERLATLLWPDRNDRMARQNLRACVASLRRDLAGSADAVLVTDDETVGLADGVVVDARRLCDLVESGKTDDLEDAARLYRGQFASDLTSEGEAFREWALAEQAKLDSAAGTVLAKLASRADEGGGGARAVDFSSRLIAIDPFREDWLRLSLRIAARHLGRDKALLQARRFVALLKKELDVEPETATLTLIEEIKAGHHGVSPPGIPTADASESGAPLPTAHRPMALSPAPVVQEHRHRPGLSFIAASAAVVVACLSVVYGPRLNGGRQSQTVGVADPPSIPLLLSGFRPQGAGTDELAGALTEDVLARVSRFSGLTVMDGRSAPSGRGSRSIGPRFQAWGSVARDGTVVHVRAGLTDTADQALVWASDYPTDGAQTADWGAKISPRIARALQVEATYATAQGLDEPNLDRAPLNQLIAKALTIQYRSPTADDETLAAPLYEKVLRRDPDNALALTGLAARLVTLNVNLLSTRESSLGAAEQLIDRALRTDPRIERAHYWLGNIYLARGQRDLALQSFERALELNPSFIPAEAHAGFALVLSGRTEEGLRRIENALAESSYDPTDRVWLRFAGIAQLERGDDEAAINALRQAASLGTPAPPLRAALASAYALAGDRAKSGEQFPLMKQAADPVALDQLLARAAKSDWSERSRYLHGLHLAASETF